MNNTQIAAIFGSIAGLLELKEESVFTIRAYQRAVRIIEHLPKELAQLVKEGEGLRKFLGIGGAIASKIHERVTTEQVVEHLDSMRFGVAVARRGWCQSKNILNTRPFGEFRSFLSSAM